MPPDRCFAHWHQCIVEGNLKADGHKFQNLALLHVLHHMLCLLDLPELLSVSWLFYLAKLCLCHTFSIYLTVHAS